MKDQDKLQVREAVGVFEDEASLQAAILDLQCHGFDRSEISLLAPVGAVEKELGHLFVSVADLEDDPDVPTVAFTSPESLAESEGALIGGLLYVGALASLIPIVASGGSLAAGLVAAGLGGGVGASIGGALASLVGERHADYIEGQLEHGGLLLWVRTWNAGDERRAVEILRKHSAGDVHVHGLAKLHPALDRHLGTVASRNDWLTYRGEAYLPLKGGAFYASGRLFPSATAMKQALDRRVVLEALFADMKPTGVKLADALADPGRVFDSPQELLESDLSVPVKVELLKRWAYDVRQEDTATGEGMPPGRESPVTLNYISGALRALQPVPCTRPATRSSAQIGADLPAKSVG